MKGQGLWNRDLASRMRACSQLCIACVSIAQGALEFVATVALAVSATAAVAVVQDGATTLFLSTDAVVLAGQRPRATEFESGQSVQKLQSATATILCRAVIKSEVGRVK